MDIRRFLRRPSTNIPQTAEEEPPGPTYNADLETPATSSGIATLASSQSDLVSVSSGLAEQLPNDLGEKHCCPKQPILTEFPSKLFGNIKRSFSTYYYNKYCWLEYSISKDAVFCFVCRHFQTNSSVEESWRKGISDWKKLSTKLEKHANSLAHQSCMVKWDNFKQSSCGSIAAKLSDSHNATVEKNRSYLCKVVDIVRLLSSLGLPFRGHREANNSESRGNYLEVCTFFSKYDSDFQSMQSNYFNATSPDFQNEIIEICANLVRTEIAEKVQDTGFFAVIADEARSSKTEQLSLCLRYTEQLEIKERFLCFIDCSASRNAAGLVDAINTGLEMCRLKNIPIVAQSYDGASVMSGQVSGVQQRIKEMHPYATYIHCLAHKLNLVLVDCCTVNRSVKTFLNVIGKLYSVFAEPSNHHRFIEVQKSLNMKPTEIAQPSETRWACKWRSLHAVKTHYAAITQCLREMRDDGEKWSVEATGLYEHMARLSFITCLIVLEDILRVIHVTHKALQSSNLTLSEAAVLTDNLKAHFVSQRQDDKWDDVWGLVKQFCRDNNISVSEDVNIQRQTPAGPGPVPPKRKRATQPPTALDSFLITTTLGHREETAVNAVQMSQSESHGFQQHLYFPVLDTIIGELDRRFTGEAVELAQACAAVLRCDKNGIEPLIQKYAQPLKINHSLVGAEMDLVKASTVGDVTREHLQKTVTKAIYPNLYKMLQLALTLPVGSATSERSFSAMRRIRNWLRLTMGATRFSALAVLHIEGDITAKLSPETIVDVYAGRKKRRLLLH